jgi:hypothetical protein
VWLAPVRRHGRGTDLRPTIRLMHELVGAGIAKDRIVTALCRAEGANEIEFARRYLYEAGFSCLKGVLRDIPSYRSLQNEGRATLLGIADTSRQTATLASTIPQTGDCHIRRASARFDPPR